MTTIETKKSRRVRRWAAVGAVLGAGAVLGYAIHAARASGIPSTQALTYAGVLEDGAGAALTGAHNVQVAVYDAATAGNLLCQMAAAQSVTLAGGRFLVTLPDACAASFGATSDTWVDVAVDGASTGRSKVGVVPYAIEANHSVTATSATTATNATLATTATNATTATGALATTISAIQGQVHPASGFHAWLTTATSVPSGGAAYTKVLFDHVEFDSGSEYSATTGTFTAKAAGVYLVVCAMEYPSTVVGGLYQSALFLNGARAGLSEITASATDGTTAEQTTITRLAANDTVWCSTIQISGAPASLYLAQATQFAVTRLY